MSHLRITLGRAQPIAPISLIMQAGGDQDRRPYFVNHQSASRGRNRWQANLEDFQP